MPTPEQIEAIDKAERLIGNIERHGPQLVARRHARTLKVLIDAALSTIEGKEGKADERV